MKYCFKKVRNSLVEKYAFTLGNKNLDGKNKTIKKNHLNTKLGQESKNFTLRNKKLDGTASKKKKWYEEIIGKDNNSAESQIQRNKQTRGNNKENSDDIKIVKINKLRNELQTNKKSEKSNMHH